MFFIFPLGQVLGPVPGLYDILSLPMLMMKFRDLWALSIQSGERSMMGCFPALHVSHPQILEKTIEYQ